MPLRKFHILHKMGNYIVREKTKTTWTGGPCYLNQLPNDIIFQIVFFLKICDRFHFSSANKNYYKNFRPRRYIKSGMINKCGIDKRLEIISRHINDFLPNGMNIPLFNFSIKVDIEKLFRRMDLDMTYISGKTNFHKTLGQHLFMANIYSKNEKIEKNMLLVKISIHDKDDYNHIETDPMHPLNSELVITTLLEEFINERNTSHILLPIMAFNSPIDMFLSAAKDNKSYLNGGHGLIDSYERKKCKYIALVHIYDLPSALMFIRFSTFLYDKQKEIDYKIIIFQVLYTLAQIQKKYESFRHNYLSCDSILLLFNSENKDKIEYKFNEIKFVIPHTEYQPMIWNFSYSTIDGIVENDSVKNYTNGMGYCGKNKYHDVHFFLNTLLINYNDKMPNSVINFIHGIVPEKYRYMGIDVTSTGHLNVNDEYTTPEKIITEDEFFAEFRSN